MKRLNQLILTGILALSIPLFGSYQIDRPPQKYLPLAEKIKEIEEDSKGIKSNKCMHKAMRYYINSKAAGENANLLIGYTEGDPTGHDLVGIEKDSKIFYIDLTKNISKKDGFSKEEYGDFSVMYVYKGFFSIEDFVKHKNYFSRNVKQINAVARKPKLGKMKDAINKNRSFEQYLAELTESITNYCKQDTAAWNYYQEYIAKNKR